MLEIVFVGICGFRGCQFGFLYHNYCWLGFLFVMDCIPKIVVFSEL
jgi:hypothetical protein